MSGTYWLSKCLTTCSSIVTVSRLSASGDSSWLFLRKADKGLKRESCLLTVPCCKNSLSFLMILLTKDFTDSSELTQLDPTLRKPRTATSRTAALSYYRILSTQRLISES